jgi:hypothetical protein
VIKPKIDAVRGTWDLVIARGGELLYTGHPDEKTGGGLVFQDCGAFVLILRVFLGSELRACNCDQIVDIAHNYNDFAGPGGPASDSVLSDNGDLTKYGKHHRVKQSESKTTTTTEQPKQKKKTTTNTTTTEPPQ